LVYQIRFSKKDKKTIYILGLNDFAPNQNLRIALFHADGTAESFEVKHTYNEQQIEWYRSGSALNKISRGKPLRLPYFTVALRSSYNQ
jgi:aconitase A